MSIKQLLIVARGTANSGTTTASTFLVGADSGYNFQIARWVLGFESDFNYNEPSGQGNTDTATANLSSNMVTVALKYKF